MDFLRIRLVVESVFLSENLVFNRGLSTCLEKVKAYVAFDDSKSAVVSRGLP